MSTLIRLLYLFRIEAANCLFDIIAQPGSTLLRGEKPDQNPADQDQHRHYFQKLGNLCIGLEPGNSGSIGLVVSVKEADDPEKRAVEKVNPFRN